MFEALKCHARVHVHRCYRHDIVSLGVVRDELVSGLAQDEDIIETTTWSVSAVPMYSQLR